MVTLRVRGELVAQTETIQLRALFADHTGLPTDLDSFPVITIQQPSGNIIIGPTVVGVYRLSTGLYGFDYAVPINAPLGVWVDCWDGAIGTDLIRGEFNFIVQNSDIPGTNKDGYEMLGSDVDFDYSQTAIHNINVLIKTLRARLDSMGKHVSMDANGNKVYTDCDIYSVASLVSFIANSLTEFNSIPYFTAYTFEDTEALKLFHDVIVQGAAIMALSSKSLLERGREFSISDNSIQFTPPTVSELMSTEWAGELANYFEKVKYIKNSLRPAPMGLGTLTVSTTRLPAVARLRHLRARQLF
jgi:hypothetical protein